MKTKFKNQPQFSVLFIVITSLLFQSGCATVFNGRTQTIRVSSDPPGAAVFVNGDEVSITPADITVKRKGSFMLRLEKAGYDPFEMKLKRKMSLGMVADMAGASFVLLSSTNYWGSFMAGLVQTAILAGPCLAIDLLTGSAYMQRPPRIEATLSPVVKAAP